MRYLWLVLILGLYACDNEDDGFDNENQKTFKLRAINVGLTGQITYARGLDFTETITLKKDSTFIKKRIGMNNTVLVSEGFFSHIRSENQDFFKFEHDIENVLIQNCTNTLIEYTVILDTRNIYNGSAVPCDGSGYSYESVE